MRKSSRGLVLLTVVAAVTALMALAPANASAVPAVVQSGTGADRTEMIIPPSFLQQLAPDDIAPDVIYPATLTFPNFPIPMVTFPITGGLVDGDNMLGVVNHAGGQRIVRYDPTHETITHSLDVTNFRIVNGTEFWGDTGGLLPGPAANLVNPSHTYDPDSGGIIFKAEVRLNAVAALILNTYFETTRFTEGMLLGNMTSYINTRPASAPGPGYTRPKGASPVHAALVPAYADCTSGNRTHQGLFFSEFCNPPEESSGFLTTGTPDANDQPAAFVGSVRMKTVPGDTTNSVDDADVGITVDVTDVRNAGSLSDYEGELLVQVPLRITDRANGATETEPATGQTTLDIAVPCTATPGSIGSACDLVTTADSLAPGTVIEGNRAIWQTDQIQVYDGGASGEAGASDATLFAVQGVFVP